MYIVLVVFFHIFIYHFYILRKFINKIELDLSDIDVVTNNFITFVENILVFSVYFSYR